MIPQIRRVFKHLWCKIFGHDHSEYNVKNYRTKFQTEHCIRCDGIIEFEDL